MSPEQRALAAKYIELLQASPTVAAQEVGAAFAALLAERDAVTAREEALTAALQDAEHWITATLAMPGHGTWMPPTGYPWAARAPAAGEPDGC